MWSRLTNLAQTVQGQVEEVVEETATASSQEQTMQSTTTTTLRRMVVQREITMSSGTTMSIQELREQFDQQQLQIEQLKHLVRENEQQLKVKQKELEETNVKFSKFKLQAKAKNMAEKKQENKNAEVKTQAKGAGQIDDGVTSEQASRGKVLLLKKKLEEKEKLLNEKNKELSIKNNQLTEQKRHLEEREIANQELNELLKQLQDSISLDSGGTQAQTQESSDSQQMFAQIVYKDNKIMELNNKILQEEQNVMSLQEHVKEKEEVIQARTKAIQLIQKEITEKDHQLGDQDVMVQKLTQRVEQDEEQLSLLREQLQEKDDQLQQETEQFGVKLQETQKYFEETLEERNSVVKTLHVKLEELNARYQQDKQVWSRRAKENIQDEALNRLEQRMREKDDIIEAKNTVIEQLQKEKTDKEKYFIEETEVLRQNVKIFESDIKAEKEKFDLILKDIKEKHETEMNEKVLRIQKFEKEIETLKQPVEEVLEKSKSEKELLQRISELEHELIAKENLTTQLKTEADEPSSSGKSGAKFLKYKAQSTAKIKALQAELDNLKKNTNLDEELVSLKNQIAELEDDKVHLHDQISELKERLERQNEDLDQHIQALNKIEKDKLTMLEHIQKLEGIIQKGKFECDTQQDILLASLKEELEQTRQFVVQIQEERDQERKERINFEMRLVEYQDYKKHAEIDIINLSEKLEEYQCEIAQLLNQLSAQEAFKLRMEEEKVALEMKVVELEEHTEGVEVQKLELIKETCRLQENLEYEKQPNIAFETEKEDLMKQLEELRIQQQGNDDEKHNIMKQLQEFKEKNENLTLQITTLNEKVCQLQIEKETVEATLKYKDIEINELQTFKNMVNNLESELFLKSEELRVQMQSVENLKFQIDSLQNEYRQIESDLLAITTLSTSTQMRLQTVTEELENKNSELKILRETLEHEAGISRERESYFEKHKQNISILEETLLEKNEIITNLQLEVQKLSNEMKFIKDSSELMSDTFDKDKLKMQQTLNIKEQKLLEYETEKKRIYLEYQEKESLLKQLDNKLQMSHEAVSSLQQERSTEDKKMETKINSLLQQLSEMENEVSILQEKNNEIEDKRAQLQDQLQNQNETIVKFESELIHYKKQLEEKDTTLINTKQMLEELAINMQEKDSWLKQLNLDLESSNQKCVEFSQTITENVIEKNNITVQIEQNIVLISQLERTLSEKEEKIESLNNDLSENVLKVENLTELTTNLIQSVDEKTCIEKSLRGQIEQLEKKLNINSEELIKLGTELTQTKFDIGSLQDVIHEKTEIVTISQNKLDESVIQWQELQKLHQIMEEDKKLSKEQLEQLINESVSLKEQIVILQADLDKAKNHCQELKIIEQNLEQEKQQLEHSYLEMAQKYTTLEVEVERLNISVRDYHGNVELSQESVNKLQAQMDQQKEIIQELQRELHSNIQQREEADISRVETETKNKQFQETITKLKGGLKKHLKEKDELVSKLENMEVEKLQYMSDKQHFEEEVQQLHRARLELLEVENQQFSEQIRSLEKKAEHNEMSKNELTTLLDKQELEKQQLFEVQLNLEENLKKQKEEINQQLISFEDERQFKEEVVLKLNNQIQLLEVDVKQSKEELNNQRKEFEILILKCQELEIELKHATDHVQMLQSSSSEHVQTLSNELEKANENIKNLNMQIITVSKQAKESKQKSDSYKTEMNKLHSELDHTLAGVAQFKTENHILKEKLVLAEFELPIMQEKLNQAENLKAEFHIKYKEKLEQSEADRDHILLLERQLKKFEQITESKNSDFEKIIEDRDLKSTQLEELSSQLTVLQDENEKLLKEKNDILLVISEKNEDLLQTQALLEKNSSIIATEKEILLQNEADLKKQLEMLNDAMLQKETEWKLKIELLTQEKNKLNLEWKQIVEENNSQLLNSEIKDLKQYINELENEKINFESLINNFKITIEEERKNNQEIEKEFENVKEYLKI